MKNVLNKTLAALVIAASTASLCAPAYAEEAPAHAEEAYTVTEDEQGTVTIEFNEPIVLFLEESSAGNEDDDIMPYETRSSSAIPRAFWGSYISEDYNYHVTILGATYISIRINYPDYGECLCSGENITSVYFDSALSSGENFVFKYSGYTKIHESTQNEFVDKPAEIGGLLHSGYSNTYIRINYITLYKA